MRSSLETEKYAHVTFFFNGGVEKQFEQETRHMIPSPRVATYDKQPEMSAQGVADKVVEILAGEDQDFVMCNFAPPDMVRIACNQLKCAFFTRHPFEGGPYWNLRCSS
jgi:2,3-bisphosphoglycerate-independent phosphoglycerate mutase